ncbi:hypothetical protein A6302_03134 [Methylobrevis pamukkalensis]|uniref:Uncharacterized protein n=2 Tax=Methylobrevis pamukkalensis TaxID=1439726 RepID=A0A1E3GZR6_9HYPH|nr:hypothetical protein A6302_03134 [Methylobrevis pamukkalensis]
MGMIDIDIEDLVAWTLNDQAADKVAAMLRSGPGVPTVSSAAIVCDTLALGAIVDRQGAHVRALGARCHPDALACYEALVGPGLTFDERIVVMGYGRMRDRPDWDIWPEITPRRHARNGKIVVEQEFSPAGKVVAAWCVLDVYPSLEIVEATRATWSMWRGALVRLRDDLSGRMVDHRLTGPRAPHEPWAAPPAPLAASLPLAAE